MKRVENAKKIEEVKKRKAHEEKTIRDENLARKALKETIKKDDKVPNTVGPAGIAKREGANKRATGIIGLDNPRPKFKDKELQITKRDVNKRDILQTS